VEWESDLDEDDGSDIEIEEGVDGFEVLSLKM